MERTRWSDERLDDRFGSQATAIERLDRDIRDLRTEMRSGFAELRGELEGMRQAMYRLFGGLFVAMVANSILQGTF